MTFKSRSSKNTSPLPSRPADDSLLQSARAILTSPCNTFEVKPWRTIMKNGAAAQKSREVKAAAKKVAARAKPYKHEAEPAVGVDETPATVVESSSTISAMGGIANQLTKEPTVTKQEKDAAAAAAKIEAKAARLQHAEAKKAAAEAEKVKKAEARALLAAAKKAAAEQAKAERAQARAAAKAERAAAAGDTKLMGALRDRTASGHYVKGANGQLRTNDDIALAFEHVPAKFTVAALLAASGLTENPYTHLNYGQQSMNLRNRLRGQLRKGTVTLDQIKAAAGRFHNAVIAEPAAEPAGEPGPT